MKALINDFKAILANNIATAELHAKKNLNDRLTRQYHLGRISAFESIMESLLNLEKLLKNNPDMLQ